MNKLTMGLLALCFAVPGMFMVIVSVPSTEFGAHAHWEGGAAAGKCFFQYHDSTGQDNAHNHWGNAVGFNNGGVVGAHYCSDFDDMVNVCEDNIWGDGFDCRFVGEFHNDCSEYICDEA